ncbi:MAG TPA: PspC domain-containing protein [Rugosimonospora sp.]|nr:PspC domain-containing protein [Rugosimonospora sp.]
MSRPQPAPVAAGPRRLYRDPQRRVVAGVASGLAEHLRLPVFAVRIAFVALLVPSGIGAVLYAAFWAVLPTRPVPGWTGPPRDRRQALPFVLLGAGVLLLQALAGWGGWDVALGWLVAVVALGAGTIWHLADPERRRRWSERMPGAPWIGAVVDSSDRRSYVLRIAGGGICVIVGLIGVAVVLSPNKGVGFATLGTGVVYAGIGLAGVALVLAPLLFRTITQLRTEREARIREQERAEVAAMVHDQVLHTLALIQRNSADPKTVVRLARGQERSLRNWLYKPTAAPSETFAAAIEEAVAEVEDAFGVAVESVVVGDRPVDERVGAVVAATREAMVNAAKHAKVETISLYAEVECDEISVFVRDRGVGFDPRHVETDRQGLRGSIIGRMKRHGGRAEVRSEPGEGTEIRLTMPLQGGAPADEPAAEAGRP